MLRKNIYVIFVIVIAGFGCSKSTDDLIQELESSSHVNRTRAGAILSNRRGEPETTKKIIALLDSDNERTVFIATQILGSLADTSAVNPLGRMSVNRNPYIREKAVLSLGSIGHESSLPFVERALEDSVSGVRHAAVRAIGHMHYPMAARYLFKMLRDKADSVRVAAVYSLYLYRTYREAGIMASDFAIPLNDKNDRVRYVTVQALGGDFPDTTLAGEMLIEALKDKNKHVRVEAITSLGKIKYNEAAI